MGKETPGVSTERITADEAVRRLDAIQPGDNESAHSEADDILVEYLEPEVRAAWWRAFERTRPWWYA